MASLNDDVSRYVREQIGENCVVSEYVAIIIATDMETGIVSRTIEYAEGMLPHHVHGLLRQQECRYAALAGRADEESE
ncbi:hypothetical protein K8O93_01120 [Gordonia bronchialis]|uniref:hypothetical protein n=1 Tax=Gordonia bronchialis TaxID=2054 RepID=UPI001CBD7E7A|nr:hypothetical protein [Gordonia bronchialis]UAK38435.1 hypothetical protein K8O93_01120 [Gordonia bronchialis]